MTEKLIQQLQDSCFDGLYQLACNCYGATVTCALDILDLLRGSTVLGTEITADLQYLADEVLVLKSNRDGNRMREAAVQFRLIYLNLRVLQQALEQTGKLPTDWRSCRVTRRTLRSALM